MKSLRKIIKKITPPIILDIVMRIFFNKKTKYGFLGNYTNWEEASKLTTGWETDIILDKINKSTNQVVGVTYSNECLETEVLIDELLQVEMVKPYFNFDTREFYDGATPEEIEQAFKDKTPAEVQLWRLRTILNLMNLVETIESALDQLPEPNQTAAKNVWNYGTTVERNSQTVLFIQSVTQMTDDQVDEIFQQAEAIVI
jgi:hypothetical protein